MHLMPWRAAVRLWKRVHEPRTISVLYFVQYLILAAGGAYALFNPPNSVAGQVGASTMSGLALVLAFGGTVGAIAALPGVYWLERTAVLSVALAAGLYLWIVLTLHFQQEGNRLLQATFIAVGLLNQGVRWVRIWERPYRPIIEPIA